MKARFFKNTNSPVTGSNDYTPFHDVDGNGSIYVMWRTFLMEKDGLFDGATRAYVMPPERSVDIDRELDFEFVEFLARRRADALP